MSGVCVVRKVLQLFLKAEQFLIHLNSFYNVYCSQIPWNKNCCLPLQWGQLEGHAQDIALI